MPGSARGRGSSYVSDQKSLAVDGKNALQGDGGTQSAITAITGQTHLTGETSSADAGQQASLNRRGNAAARRELEDSERIYSNVEQKSWEQKYKFFSARHMERSYRLFTRARHDPFNKDPSWGKSIIKKVSDACTLRKVCPEALFNGVDITGDGNLNRPELKRVVCSLLPGLSDEELTAIFDTIDDDQSGEVNVQEFCEIVRKGHKLKVSDAVAHRWRNPVHRIKRLSPAQIEGWDHLEEKPLFHRADKLCEFQQSGIQDRIGETLEKNATGGLGKSLVVNRPKYDCFAGGADSDRFRTQKWIKEKRENPTSSAQTTRITDPGPYPKPGWMYNTEMRERTDQHGTKFILPPESKSTPQRWATARSSSEKPNSARAAAPRPPGTPRGSAPLSAR